MTWTPTEGTPLTTTNATGSRTRHLSSTRQQRRQALTSRTGREGRRVRRHLADVQNGTVVGVARVRRSELKHPLTHVLESEIR